MENWKEIPGFEGRYEISNLGRVKSLLRGVRILSPVKKSTGYLTITLSDSSGVPHQKLLHRLVLIAFTGKNEEMMTLHNDGNKENNALSNLRWGTAKENAADSALHGTVRCGESHRWAKLTEAIICEIRAASDKEHKRKMRRKYGLSRQHVNKILGRKMWKHIP